MISCLVVFYLLLFWNYLDIFTMTHNLADDKNETNIKNHHPKNDKPQQTPLEHRPPPVHLTSVQTNKQSKSKIKRCLVNQGQFGGCWSSRRRLLPILWLRRMRTRPLWMPERWVAVGVSCHVVLDELYWWTCHAIAIFFVIGMHVMQIETRW